MRLVLATVGRWRQPLFDPIAAEVDAMEEVFCLEMLMVALEMRLDYALLQSLISASMAIDDAMCLEMEGVESRSREVLSMSAARANFREQRDTSPTSFQHRHHKNIISSILPISELPRSRSLILQSSSGYHFYHAINAARIMRHPFPPAPSA